MNRALVSLAMCIAIVSSRPAHAALGARPLIEALGTRAWLTVILHPARWTAKRPILPMLSQSPERMRPLVSAWSAPTAWKALGHLLDASAWPDTLDGQDLSRPIVASLFEPTLSGPGSLAALTASEARTPSDKSPIGFRHHVLVPSRDLGKTERALRTVTAQLTRFVCSVARGADFVAVEIAPAAAPPAPRSTASLADTPALSQALSSTDLVIFYLRLDRAGLAYQSQGARNVLDALRHADPAQREVIAAAGLAEILGGQSTLGPDVEADVSDLSIGCASNALVCTMVASLTPSGSRAALAGAPATGPRFELRGKHSTARFAFDLTAASDAAMLPKRFATPMKEWIRTIQECGFGCFIDLALRFPFVSMKKTEMFSGAEQDLALAVLKRLFRSLGEESPTTTPLSQAIDPTLIEVDVSTPQLPTRIRARISLVDSALVTQLARSDDQSREPSLPKPPRFTALRSTPAAGAEPSAACLDAAIAETIRGLRAFTMVDDASRGNVVEVTRKRLAPHIDCAKDSAPYAAEIARLRAALESFAAPSPKP